MLLVLVFKNRSSRRWAFVPLIGARLYSAYRFLPSRADAVCPIGLLIYYMCRRRKVYALGGAFSTSTGQRGNQYCSLVEPVLVTNSDQYCFAS